MLAVKLDCKVVIIRNLENGLVNGMSAKVQAITDDTITVKVDSDPFLSHKMAGLTFELHRYKFLMRDAQNHITAIRTQFPMALGYALTVHKAQDRSIPELVVDAYNFWHPGQLGVAIGRATTKEGLQVQNYNTFAATMKHPQSVLDFYASRGLPIAGNKTCCQSTITDEKLRHVEQNLTLNTNMDSELTDHQFSNRNTKKFPYNLQQFLDDNQLPEFSDHQKERNAMLQSVREEKVFITFLTYLYNKVVYFVENYKIPPKGVKCNWCAMVSHIHKFLLSSQHIQQCMKAFNTKNLSAIQNKICTELFHALLTKYTTKPHDTYVNRHPKLDPSHLDNDLKATVRYIAGAALNTVANKLKCSVNNKMLHQFEDARAGFRAVQILNTLRVPQSVIVKDSQEPESLMQIIRRQGSSQGLTHISDTCFQFFCELFVEMDFLQNEESIISDPTN